MRGEAGLAARVQARARSRTCAPAHPCAPVASVPTARSAPRASARLASRTTHTSPAPAPPSTPSVQCNLAYKKLGISPIVMSAGELESGNAGEPAKLIRQRYR